MFRKYEEKDSLKSSELITQLGYETTESQFIERMKRILDNPNQITYVWEQDEEVVGFIGGVIIPMYEYDQDFFRVNALVVDEKCRNQKIGAKIMHELETMLKEMGVESITLNSRNIPMRYPAHAFYRKLGYENSSLTFFKKI